MERQFHISDILSMVTGIAMSFTESMEMPDGTQRPAYARGPMTGPVRLTEFVLDREVTKSIFNPAEINAAEFLEMYGSAKQRVIQQLPWVSEIPIDKDALAGSGPEKEAYRREWINTLASVYGVWHSLKQDAVPFECGDPAPPAQKGPRYLH